MHRLGSLLIVVALACTTGLRSAAAAPPPRGADPVYANAVVAADHPEASRAGVEILMQGGNVVDAAVATAFARAVVRPASAGLGGGGFMVIWDAAKQRSIAIDYRERAPQAATREMFIDPEDPTRPLRDASSIGHRAVAVPGHVAGLCHAVREYGTKDLKTVLAPALRLCRVGVVPDAHDIEIQAELLATFQKRPEFQKRFSTLYQRYLNGGRPWNPGERFYSPLTSALSHIAENGADGFYRGYVGEAIAREMKTGGGLITLEDLAQMQPTVREALVQPWEGFDLVTMPPPSSGGVALIETLRIVEAIANRAAAGAEPPAAVDRAHRLVEAFKHAFADRAAYLGDTDYAAVPVARLISAEYAAALAERFDPAQVRPAAEYGRYTAPDDKGTTHFSIIDRAGNAVACTETINTGFGSLVVEPDFGIILNNEMDDFTSHPEASNAFGLRQSEANSIAPGKRPLSSMTPTIAVRDGKAVFALGGSGGPRIITATTQVLWHMARDGKTPAEAVAAPRLHHQWQPDELLIERGMGAEFTRTLRQRGHTVRIVDENAVVQAVARTPEGLRAASDRRKHGQPAGY